MKHHHITYLIATFFTCSFLGAFGQRSEDLIPQEAVTVFSINNISLLSKVSMDELITYEFMEEIQQEIFDGSTQGKTLKDSGIDFDQKLNVFYGQTERYELAGFTFGIKDKKQLFSVFDDFEQKASKYPGTEFYSSFFNNLIIKGNSGLLIRIEPTGENIDEVADSIWYERGNESPWIESGSTDGMDGDFQEEIFEEAEEEAAEGIIEEIPNVDKQTSELEKNYYELRDSVQVVLQNQLLDKLIEDLIAKNISLTSQDERFRAQLAHTSDGIFYLDNSRSAQNLKGLWYFQTMFPSLYQDLRSLYSGNVLLGDLTLNEHSVGFNMISNYGEELGEIYQNMNSAKFDKHVLDYIHEDNTAFFTYNIDLRKAYEKAYEIIMPILEDEKNAQISANVLTIELLNEFINKDALFNTYKGSMFGTFNGIKKIKTTKIEFYYDEETFEYGEKEVEAEEDMPIFTVGFTTARGDIPEKVLNHLSRLTSRFHEEDGYWVYEDAILESAPLYMINAKGLFIFTNDEDLAMNHTNGYGSESLSKKERKRAKQSGFMYAKIDWAKAIDRFPSDFFNDRQNEIINAMRGKTGLMELTTSKTSKEKTSFDLVYNFAGQYDSAGKYLLDLLNSIYVIVK